MATYEAYLATDMVFGELPSGIVTRLTLQVHRLPERFGAVNFVVKASSDAAFRQLIGVTVDFFARYLVGPHWGEQIRFLPDNSMRVSMVFQGMDRGDAKTVWSPLLDKIDASGSDLSIEFAPFKIVSTSAAISGRQPSSSVRSASSRVTTVRIRRRVARSNRSDPIKSDQPCRSRCVCPRDHCCQGPAIVSGRGRA